MWDRVRSKNSTPFVLSGLRRDMLKWKVKKKVHVYKFGRLYNKIHLPIEIVRANALLHEKITRRYKKS